MQGAMRILGRFLRDFALGVHIANGIRHGVPDAGARKRARAERATVVECGGEREPARDARPPSPAL